MNVSRKPRWAGSGSDAAGAAREADLAVAPAAGPCLHGRAAPVQRTNDRRRGGRGAWGGTSPDRGAGPAAAPCPLKVHTCTSSCLCPSLPQVPADALHLCLSLATVAALQEPGLAGQQRSAAGAGMQAAAAPRPESSSHEARRAMQRRSREGGLKGAYISIRLAVQGGW